MLIKKYLSGKSTYSDLIKWILNDLKKIDNIYKQKKSENPLHPVILSLDDVKDCKVIPDIMLLIYEYANGVSEDKFKMRYPKSFWRGIIEIFDFVCAENCITIIEVWDTCKDGKYGYRPLTNGGSIEIRKCTQYRHLPMESNNSEFINSMLLKPHINELDKIANVIMNKVIFDIKSFGLDKLLIKSNCVSLELYIVHKFRNILSKFVYSDTHILIEKISRNIIEVVENGL